MQQTFLMCEPAFYDVEYEINPWMEHNVGYVNKGLATKQWENLYNQLSQFANIKLINPVEGLPDMVFTANAGMVDLVNNSVWVSRFANQQRQGEESVFAQWFIEQEYKTFRGCGDTISDKLIAFFEGAGDGLVDTDNTYWLGHGMRSTKKAVEFLGKIYPNHVVLRMTSPWFYHLDTCFCPLSNGDYLIYPEAFETLEHVSKYSDRFITVDERDAEQFACNAVCVENNIIMPNCSDELVHKLEERGYNVYLLDFSEFLKSGGAAKCLTLRIS